MLSKSLVLFSVLLCIHAAAVQNAKHCCCSVYRLLTSPFIHGGLLHIAFNMMAFVPIGCSLERTMGSFALTHLIGLLIFLGAGIYIGLATAAAATAFRCVCLIVTVIVKAQNFCRFT